MLVGGDAGGPHVGGGDLDHVYAGQLGGGGSGPGAGDRASIQVAGRAGCPQRRPPPCAVGAAVPGWSEGVQGAGGGQRLDLRCGQLDHLGQVVDRGVAAGGSLLDDLLGQGDADGADLVQAEPDRQDIVVAGGVGGGGGEVDVGSMHQNPVAAGVGHQ